MDQIRKFIGFNPDFIGSAAALLCAVHCMVFPLLLSIGLASSTHHNHMFDFVFMIFGIGIAAFVLVRDYMKHRVFVPVLISIFGFVLLYCGVESHGSMFYLSVTGGVLITYAHFQNWRLSHRH